MQHKDRLSDEERKARRLESKRKYRDANREKLREAGRAYMAEKREDPEFRARDKVYKADPGYKDRQKAYRLANSSRLSAQARLWQLSNLDKFKRYQKLYQIENRHATIQRLKDWRHRNSDRSAAYERAWRTNNRDARVRTEQNRRARARAGGVLSKCIQARLMVVQRGLCAVCKCSLLSAKRHLDHIMPLKLGGLNVDSNVQLLCKRCNLQKSAKHPVDFMRERGFLL